jgi:predicted glycoside hydrolase/deacetylase ChbG (UPF0249 family)
LSALFAYILFSGFDLFHVLIINARLGRSVAETDAAFKCYRGGRITCVSAMVFMHDSGRAAELAKANELDVGFHLNFSEELRIRGVQNNFESTTAE